MWNLGNIRLRNFKSHLSTNYNFLTDQTTMVYGRNMDDSDGADSNGSGKSSVMQGITYALVGSPDRKLSKEDYIMDGMKYSTVVLTLNNTVTSRTLQIERILSRGSKAEELVLFEDGIKNEQITSVAEGNERILELLDITKDDLLNYYIINQENSHSFFRAGDAEKKQIMSRFTNTQLLDIVLDEIEGDYLIMQQKIGEFDEETTTINGKLETLDEQLTYEKTQRSEENKQEIEKITPRIRKLAVEIRSQEAKKEAANDILSGLNAKLKAADEPKDVEDLLSQKKITNLALPDKEKELKEVQKTLGEIEAILAGTIECPQCKHEFSVKKMDKDIESYKEAEQQCQDLKAGLDKNIQELNDKLSSIGSEISANKDLKDTIKRLKKKVEGCEEDLVDVDRRITEKKGDITTNKERRTELENFTKNTKRIKELESTISIHKKRVTELATAKEQLEEQLEDVEFWKINFSDAGMKTFLINKVLESLEGYVNLNLRSFNMNLLVKIEGFTVLKDKQVREKIDVLVSKDEGRSWHKYGRFSGGQRERINVSGILTLRNLINMSSKSGGLNFLGLDETFDGLDVKGQRMVLPILEGFRTTIMVISHNNNDIGAMNQLWIDYEDGVSRIAS